MIRRLIYVCLAFYTEIIIFQILGIFYINIFMLIYTGTNRPLSTKLRNRIELFNEFCICYISIHLVIFTDWVPSFDAQYLMGFSMIGVMGFNIFVNMLAVGVFGLLQLRLVIIKYFRRFVF